MTEAQAEKLATLFIGVAATGAAWFILRTPALRRAAWSLATTAAAAAGPWFVAEVRTAWAASGRSGARAAAPAGTPPAA
jgi:hypothetical protein